MKKIILFAIALFVTVTSNAQGIYGKPNTINPIGKSSVGNGLLQSSATISDTEFNKTPLSTWSNIMISYNEPFYTDKDLDSGFSVGYHTSMILDRDLKLFLEYGGVASYSSYGQNTDSYDIKDTYFDVKIPANLAFRFSLSDKVSVIPYAGLNLKVGVLATSNVDYTEGEEKSKELNLYSSDDVSDSEKMNRINLGVQYGVNLTYKVVCFGIGWENDFTETYTDNKYGNFAISLGYLF